jgi:hypothetical protein
MKNEPLLEKAYKLFPSAGLVIGFQYKLISHGNRPLAINPFLDPYAGDEARI